MKRQKREINTSLLDQVTADMLGGEEIDFLHDNSLRVERILLEMVRPDPVQPRRVLPEPLHLAFHSNRLTPTQALKELVQMVQVTARQRGRPFNNVLELLPNPDDEDSNDQDTKLSPEEQLLRDLVNLAMTIRRERWHQPAGQAAGGRQSGRITARSVGQIVRCLVRIQEEAAQRDDD